MRLIDADSVVNELKREKFIENEQRNCLYRDIKR